MKIHWLYKTFAFIASVLTLSGFFAGWRLVHQEPGLNSWGILLGSTAATLLLLFLQGFWIYAEEKQKGTLGKRINLFESLYTHLMKQIKVDVKEEVSCCSVETKKA